MKHLPRPKRRVVIIDDSRTMQVLLETAFSDRPDFSLVGIAGSAQLGAEMITLLKPDIATIDLRMPYIDGAGLLEMVDRPPNTCMIMVSDHSIQNVMMTAKLLSLGAEACLSKREVCDNRNSFFDKINAAHDSFLVNGKRGNESIAIDLKNVEQPRISYPHDDVTFGFPVPPDENRRLNFLSSSELANAVSERQFDLVTKHLAAVTAFPVCLLTFIDKDTQWIKSRVGLDAERTPREQAFCNYTICQDEAFVVANAAADRRFAANPLVAESPHIRSYAGYPITTRDRTRIGALCLIDIKPRAVSSGALRQLAGLAEIVSEMIEQRPTPVG